MHSLYRPTGRWTGRRCRSRAARGRTWRSSTWPRGHRRSRRWSGSGARCWASSRWGFTTTSSSWAATRCWPHSWSLACGIRFQVEVPLRELFEHPTVARLAAAIERVRGEGRADFGPAAEACGADRGSAALLRSGAVVVPGPVGAGQPLLQHAGRGPGHRTVGRGGVAGQPERDREKARGVANHVCDGGRAPCAADRRAASRASGGGRSERSSRKPSGRRRSAAGRSPSAASL